MCKDNTISVATLSALVIPSARGQTGGRDNRLAAVDAVLSEWHSRSRPSRKQAGKAIIGNAR